MNDKKLKKDKSVKAHDAATHLSTSHHGRSASAAPVAQSGLSPLMRNVIGWVLPVLGLVAIAVALLAYDSDFLFRVQELNLFLYTPLFFEQQMVFREASSLGWALILHSISTILGLVLRC